MTTPTDKTPLWYAAVKKTPSGNYHADVLKLHKDPTQANHPIYNYMFGGYRTRKEAIRVAQYHNYTVDCVISDGRVTVI